MDSRIRIHMTESPRERANGREVEIAWAYYVRASTRQHRLEAQELGYCFLHLRVHLRQSTRLQPPHLVALLVDRSLKLGHWRSGRGSGVAVRLEERKRDDVFDRGLQTIKGWSDK